MGQVTSNQVRSNLTLCHNELLLLLNDNAVVNHNCDDNDITDNNEQEEYRSNNDVMLNIIKMIFEIVTSYPRNDSTQMNSDLASFNDDISFLRNQVQWGIDHWNNADLATNWSATANFVTHILRVHNDQTAHQLHIIKGWSTFSSNWASLIKGTAKTHYSCWAFNVTKVRYNIWISCVLISILFML